MHWHCKLTMCNQKYMNWAKQLPILTVSCYLYMTESVQSVIASNIVQDWTMKSFNKALNAYVNDSKKDLRNLSGYAKKLRVHKKVTELMEVLLNG